jgi:predicted metal-dependent HD superfamily phosphohydrolase
MPMISPERLDGMQKAFLRLLEPFGATPSEIYAVFDELVTRYSEPARHYHTLEHLAEMFRVAGRLSPDVRNFTDVQLAIWFHDAIYDPTRSDNEAMSAELAETQLDLLRVPDAQRDRVTDLILATQHETEPTTPDAQVLLDADLAILGAAGARYDRYAHDIRREYAHVPEEDYRRGRTAVLRKFLARKTIYHTSRMLAAGEATARANIEREIAMSETR